MTKKYLFGASEDEFDEMFFSEDDTPIIPSHEDNADTLVLPNLVNKRPGMLRTRGDLTLHTRSAHRLFYGRRRDDTKKIKPIIGLVRFAHNMNQIYDLAAADDPYADAVLLKVENELDACRKSVTGHIAELEELLSDMDGISINFHESMEPVKVQLEFKTAYGFLAARILSQYDKLICLALSAMHVGLLFQEDWARVVGKSGRMIRYTYQLSTSYRFTGVSRVDIQANNSVARTAIEKYGELPQIILKAEKRSKFAPTLPRSK